MAHRDSSQGFGFMYADISKLLAKRKELDKADGFTPLSTEGQTVNFNKDKGPVVAKPIQQMQSTEGFNHLLKDRANAIATLKDNLDRLQSLHHKLHSMLDEINKLSDREPKKK